MDRPQNLTLEQGKQNKPENPDVPLAMTAESTSTVKGIILVHNPHIYIPSGPVYTRSDPNGSVPKL